MKTIYNTYVKMESQEQCDRMQRVCVENGLPCLIGYDSFELSKTFQDFGFYKNQFAVWNLQPLNEKISESEWSELLKTTK